MVFTLTLDVYITNKLWLWDAMSCSQRPDKRSCTGVGRGLPRRSWQAYIHIGKLTGWFVWCSGLALDMLWCAWVGWGWVGGGWGE